MLFANYRRWLNRDAQRSKQVRKPAALRFRPTIEALEGRLAPAVLTVNTLLDTTDSGAYLSLRDAMNTVAAADTSAMPAGSLEMDQILGTLGQNDTIVFASGLTGTITLGSALPQIIRNVQILGPGASQVTIDGASAFQIFNVAASVAQAMEQVSIAGLTLENGYAVNGGAIQVGSAGEDALDATNVSVSDCTFVGNRATDGVSGGGAIAISFANLTATHCVFTDNSAPVGGAITNDGGTLELSNDFFTGNDGSAYGGGGGGAGGAISMVYPSALTAVQNSVFTDNITTGSGGAIDSSNGSLILTNDSFTDNMASNSGGAISNGGPLAVTASTFAGNSALFANGGAIDANGPAVIVNSTFAENSCGFSGGGVCAEAGSITLQLTNDTLSGNTAYNGYGNGVDVESPAAATLDNTIVAENYSANSGFDDLHGAVAGSNNLIGISSYTPVLANGVNGNSGNIYGAPALLPLGNYGGPTETMPPAAGSPAIGAGTVAFVASSETDQRGFTRTTGGTVDIGAVEVQPGGVATHLELQGPATVTAGVPMSWTAVALDDNGLPAYTAFGPVVMSVASGPGSFTATSTTLANAVYGTASFSNLTLDTSGYYTLQASFGNSSITAPLVVDPGAPFLVTPTSGGNQAATVGTAFGSPLVATVLDQFGNPVPGVPVMFVAPSSGASGIFSNATADITGTTNGDGQASEAFTAEGLASSALHDTYQVGAEIDVPLTASGVSITVEAFFFLTNDLLPTQVLLVSGATKSVMGGDAVAPLTVKTEDKNGNPVPGTVTFTVTPAANGAKATFAGATTTATVSTSLVNGLYEAVAPTLTANRALGSYKVVATVSGGTKSATFTITNIADPIVGPSQSAVVNTKYATPFYAKVTDGLGNPLAGMIVTFTAPASGPGGSFGGRRTVTERTNAAGIATAPAFTANTRAGSLVVTVGFNGAAPPETIALTNLAGPPKHLTLISGSPQSAALNTDFAVPLQVRITDAFGNVVSGAQVTFTIQPNALLGATGSFGGAASVTQTSNTSGLAIAPLLTAAGKPGRFTVIARIAGVTSDAVFDLTVDG